MSIKNKLNRMKKHLQLESAAESKEVFREQETKPETGCGQNMYIPNKTEWEKCGAKAFFSGEEYCLIREVEYSLDHQHGNYRLGDILPLMEEWQESEIVHPLSAKGHKAPDLFFFDTETTGLSGGTGTTIFLLGYARVLKDKVIVRQHLLPGPGNEVALYQSFLEEVDYTTLVTYNGKAFDWPQVKTRHTLVREHVPKLPAFGHYDLLHASRRLWKNKMESVRLANVEKEILGIQRTDDIPGFLAPMIYFDFIKTHEMQGIKGVLKHNEWDVLTLITLYTHLSKLLLVKNTDRNEREEYEIGRWYDALGEKEAAASLYENIVETSWQAAFKLGLLKKYQKDFKQAKKLFLQCFEHENNERKYEAGIELAKILEHQEKDYQQALFYAAKSYLHHQEIYSLNTKKTTVKTHEFVKRINRLHKKAGN
jgi:uncharacterized protein YprB with RNaseH-like and TPR domain